jgi:hypothetical protein
MPERISILLAVALADLLCTLDLVFQVWRTWVFFWNLAQRCSMLHLEFEVVNRDVHSGSEAGRFQVFAETGLVFVSPLGYHPAAVGPGGLGSLADRIIILQLQPAMIGMSLLI